MPIKSILTAVSVLGLLSVTGVANAGNCAGPDCRLGVSYMQGPAPQFGPITVQDRLPMGHLRSINFQRAPNISIMRVHSLEAGPGLSDAPVAFTAGCHPQSTQYCRQDGVAPAAVEIYPPQPQTPIYTGQVSIPTNYTGQVSIPTNYSGQVSIPTTYSSQTVDYSLFQPRQYGDAGFVPGIALIPTSRVDRNPDHADLALNSGRAVPQALANGGVAPRPSMMRQSHIQQGQMRQSQGYSGQVSIPTTYAYGVPQGYNAPAYAPAAPHIPVPNYVPAPQNGMAGAPVLQNNGTFGSTVGADGTYWEKVSGPTFFGDTLASQVICKRQGETRAVNPVVGVPVPTCNLPQPLAVYEGRGSASYPGGSY